MSWQHPLLPDGLPMNHGAMAAAEDGSAQALDTSIPTQRLSCEQCRARKVKCDRIHPCTPCTGKQVKCTFPGGFKPRQKRQRPAVSSSYEDKIDEISSKLDQIRTAIDTIGLSSHPIANAPGTSHSNAFPRGTLTPVTSSSYRGQSPLAASNRDDLSEVESEDDTPLRTHAAHAADLVQQMVDSTCSGLTPDVTSSLDALQRIVQTKAKRKLQTATTSPAKGAETPAIEGLKLSPLETAMMCLGMVRENETIKYLCFFELESVGDFVEYLPSCYSQKPSITDLIIVNVGLARIFYCCSFYEPDAHLRAEYESQSTACYRNIDLVMPQLPFSAAHTFDLALALCMASSHYMEIARPRMAWKLAVHSTHVCQSLGFNRGDIENSSAARRQKRLFIMCCVMEKTLAFCLGKASVIRSSDMPTVDVEMTDGFSTSLDPLWRKWIDIALVQDQVYDDLCSPRALMQPGGVRDARARYLAAELEKLFFTQDSAETRCLQAIRDSVGDTIADIFWRSMRISGLAMLTLIYRTAPPGTDAGSAFSASCISAAVQALEEHQQCMRLLENVSHSMLDFYVQWALLSAPFVPYIVVFCLTVETSSAYYLTKLASVVEATEKVASTYREVYEKQLAIFRLMYDVACKCVEARNSGSEASRQPEKLAAGTVSVPADPNMTAASSSFPFDQSFGFQSLDPTVASMGADHSAAMPGGNMAGLSLGDWMDQNYQIFQLLEEDAVMDWDTRGAPGK